MTDNRMPPPLPQTRPRMVWAIFIVYVVMVALSMLMQVLMRVGALHGPPVQHEFIQHLRSVDYLATYSISALLLTGVTLLWLLRRQAFPVLMVGFVLNAANIARNVIKPSHLNLIDNFGVAGIVSATIAVATALAVSAGILAYTWNLRRRGVLQ